MRTSRSLILGAGILSSFIACLLLAASRPVRVAPNITGGDLTQNNGQYMFRTLKTTTAGCSGCHFTETLIVSNGKKFNLDVVTDGPLPGSSALLAAGATGTFVMTTANYSCDGNPFKLGIDVAASDGTLAPADGTMRTYQGELTHTLPTPTFTCTSNNNTTGIAKYNFNYTVPQGALPGSAHKLFGVLRASPGGFTWSDLKKDANGNAIQPTTTGDGFNVIVPLGSSGPTSVSESHDSGSVTLTWSGGTAISYRIAYKEGNSAPLSANENGASLWDPKVGKTTFTISNLKPSTTYSFGVWGKSELRPGFGIGDYYYSSNAATVTVTTSAVSPPPPNIPPPLPVTGSMGTARYGHTATLLYNGKILIAGGQNASGSLSSAELYDPVKGTFSPTADMVQARSGHTATPLLNGMVLIAGGTADGSAELYDPVAGVFTATGSMSTARSGDTATLLANGKVLIVGGSSTSAAGELYDPSTATFSSTSNGMQSTRFSHTATLLSNGTVLIAGGSSTAGGTALQTADLYDPGTNLFTATGNMAVARKDHTATALPLTQTGTTGSVVLLIGGSNSGGELNTTEEYLAATGTFGFPANSARSYASAKHTATLLTNSKVLVTGGRASNASLIKTEFIIEAGSFDTNKSLNVARSSHTATLLTSGKVLIAGGIDAAGNPLASAEMFDLTRLEPANGATMTASRYSHTATLLPSGKVLVAGGGSLTAPYELNSAELYDPDSSSFSATTGSMAQTRVKHTATLLRNGKVLVAGGSDGNFTTHLASAELYDPATNTFSATGGLATGRFAHTATLLSNGKVLIAGGEGVSGNLFVPLTSAELYDPGTGTFSATGSMGTARYYHTATLLGNGKVLIAGGTDGTIQVTGQLTGLASAELYDPATGTFSATSNLLTSRHHHAAALLPDGRVFIAGGSGGPQAGSLDPAKAELYDPQSGTFALANCCPTNSAENFLGRIGGTASVLPDGRVLIYGGYNESSSNQGFVLGMQLYDPSTDSNVEAGNTVSGVGRRDHTATQLRDGAVMMAGGTSQGTFPNNNLNTSEIYKLAPSDCGNCEDYRRPAISSKPSVLHLPATSALTGLRFRGDAETSSGTSQNSPTNVPLLQLQRVDNNATFWIAPSAASDTSFTSPTIQGLPEGYYRAVIFTGGIPSSGFAYTNVQPFTLTNLQTLISIKALFPSELSLSSSANPSTYGQSVTFTASVSPPAATGTVTFKDGATTLATPTLSNGIATFSTSSLATGDHSITAAYSGDDDYQASTSPITQSVNKATTTTTLTSSPNPSATSQSVTFTATVSPSAATGTVTFTDGVTTLGTGALSNGTATFSTSSLAAGTHSITASYGGDANYLTSTSAALSQTVSQNLTATTTTLVSSSSTSTAFQSVTFTATVSPSAASGTVTFKDGATTLGSGTLANGSATFTTSTLSPGTHSITAVYAGDSSYSGSTSNAITQTVNKVTTTTTLTSSGSPSAVSQQVTFTATVAPSTASGTVTFTDGATTLGTGSLSGGTATFSTSSLSAGTHSITAAYGGDTNHLASTSATLSQTVDQTLIATTTTVTASPSPSKFGQTVHFTAAVSPYAQNNVATVTFKDGGNAFGTAPLSNGTAIIGTSSLPVGTHSITASYAGEGLYAANTSDPITHIVKPCAGGGPYAYLFPHVIDTNTDCDVDTITGATFANATVVRPDGAKAFAVSGKTVFFVDLVTKQVTPLDLTGIGAQQLRGMALSPDGTKLYVVDHNDFNAKIYVFDTATNQQTDTISYDDGSNLAGGGVVAHPDGKRLIVNSDHYLGILVIDVTTKQVTKLIATGKQVQSGGDIALTPDGHWAYAAAYSDQKVFIIDVSTAGQESAAGSVDVKALNAFPQTVVITPNKTSPNNDYLIYVAGGVIDNATKALIPNKTGADSAAITPDGTKIYVAKFEAVDVINTATNQVVDTLAAAGYNGGFSFGNFIGPQDRDSDGVIDQIEGATKGTFTDKPLGGISDGSIVDVGGPQGKVSVWRAFPGGFYARASGGVSNAKVNVCGKDVLITQGGVVKMVCGSLTLNVVSGQSKIVLGSNTFASITAGGAAKVTDISGGFQVDNVGTTTITIVNSQDQVLASVAPGQSYTAATASTTTTLSSSVNPSTFGQSVTFTATVSPSAATGTVTFKDGATTLGTGSLTSGTATFTTSSLTTGSHSITAVYSGDTNYATSTSAATTQTVNKASTTTTLTSSANPSATSQSVTFTAAVSPSAATGTVTFLDGATTLGTGTLSSGTATFSTSSLTAGTHSITASYGGDTNYLTSTSDALSQTVSQSITPTTTTLASSSSTSTYGQSVTFTATVSPSTATGAITFKDGATTLGTATLAGGSAAFTTSSLGGGTHSMTAVYAGDSSNSGSTSNVITQTVNPASTTTTLSSSASSSTFGQSVTFTATVSPSAATGTVTFKEGATTLGTGSLTSGTATFTTSSLTTGSHSITAVYSGDTNYATSTSAATTQTVNKASTTTTLTSSANPSATSQSVTFTATVSPSAATGTVTFTDGATTLGTGTLSSGTATFSTSSLTAGTHSITASYSADANYLASTSAALQQTVSATLTATTTTLTSPLSTSPFGQSVPFTATVSPSAATGTVTFMDGATTLGTGSLSGGTATFATSSLAVGTHSITASYGGDANYAASTSAALTLTVIAAQGTAPTVTAINPNKGSASGGTAVTITGTGFQSGATVTIGGTAATNVTFVSATSLTARTPSHATGAVNVTVTNPDTLSGTLAGGFTYVPSGDANGDGQVTVADVFYLINNLFVGGPAAAAGDANGDGQATVADVFYLINYLFAGGPAPK